MVTKLPEEDKALFQAAMADVTPLHPTKKHAEKKPLSVKKDHHRSAIEKLKPSSVLYLSDPYDYSITAACSIHFIRLGFSPKRFKELQKGLIPWQATLDLHHLNMEQAKEYFIQFINNALKNKHRSLLIIHGKGGYNGAAPVLKNLVSHWLPQIPELLAFTSALPKHGGVGAVYVLLKKSRLK